MRRSGFASLTGYWRPAASCVALGLLVGVTGCDGTTQVTFLDVLNTVFLGITAAGGYVLLRNA